MTTTTFARPSPRLPRLCLMFAAIAACAFDAPTASRLRPDLAVIATRIVDQTNVFRVRNELGKLEIETRLSQVAQEYAEFMADNDRIAHDADGRTAPERVKAAGYEYCMVAENIAYVFNSVDFATEPLAARFMQNWEKSPDHRRNLLLPPVTQIGVGIAQSARSRRYYAVQLLARPSSAALQFEVANRAGVPVEYELSGERFALPPLVTRLHSRCAAATLSLLPADPRRESALAVKGGTHYVVEGTDAGQLRLRAE